MLKPHCQSLSNHSFSFFAQARWLLQKQAGKGWKLQRLKCRYVKQPENTLPFALYNCTEVIKQLETKT